MGASRLQAISSILGVPVSFFFEDAPGEVATGGFAESQATDFVVDFLGSAEGLQLNRAFVKIRDAKVRRKIIDLVKALASQEDE